MKFPESKVKVLKRCFFSFAAISLLFLLVTLLPIH